MRGLNHCRAPLNVGIRWRVHCPVAHAGCARQKPLPAAGPIRFVEPLTRAANRTTDGTTDATHGAFYAIFQGVWDKSDPTFINQINTCEHDLLIECTLCLTR